MVGLSLRNGQFGRKPEPRQGGLDNRPDRHDRPAPPAAGQPLWHSLRWLPRPSTESVTTSPAAR